MNNNIKKISALSEKSRVSNEYTTGKEYTITADVQSGSEGVQSIDNAIVTKDGQQVATFYHYGHGNSGVNYNVQLTRDEKIAMMDDIDTFIENCEAESEN